MDIQKFIEQLEAAIAMERESYKFLLDRTIAMLKNDSNDGQRVSTHLGHNLGARAAEFSCIASKVEMLETVLRTVRIKAEEK